VPLVINYAGSSADPVKLSLKHFIKWFSVDDLCLSQKLIKLSNPGAFQLAVHLIAVLRSSSEMGDHRISGVCSCAIFSLFSQPAPILKESDLSPIYFQKAKVWSSGSISDITISLLFNC